MHCRILENTRNKRNKIAGSDSSLLPAALGRRGCFQAYLTRPPFPLRPLITMTISSTTHHISHSNIRTIYTCRRSQLPMPILCIKDFDFWCLNPPPLAAMFRSVIPSDTLPSMYITILLVTRKYSSKATSMASSIIHMILFCLYCVLYSLFMCCPYRRYCAIITLK